MTLIYGNKDSLCVWWVHHYYFRGNDVWNYNTFSSDSVLIKKIIQIRDFIISKELSTEEAKKRIQSWSTNEQLLVDKVYEYIKGVKPTLVGVLLYGIQQFPLRCLSFFGLLKWTGCLLLTKLIFWTRVPSALYV